MAQEQLEEKERMGYRLGKKEGKREMGMGERCSEIHGGWVGEKTNRETRKKEKNQEKERERNVG